MTTLAITPNWKNKTAKFKGTVAAGEHVSVTIQNDDGEGGEFIDDASTLRLRVVNPCNGRTLAIFPEPVPEGETPETWDADLSPLRCTLNLNTVQMLKDVPPAANVPLLWVLDDYDNKTLYFKEQFPVEHWPRLRGEEEPTDLDNYKDIIADFNTRLTTAEQTVATAATNAQSAANSASAAASSAATAATAATDAQTGATASKNAAQTAANDAASAKTAAETAQGKAEEAQEAAETARGKAQEYAEAAAESAAAFVVDDTFSVEGAAADAKAVGEANQDLITQINTVQDNLNAETTARETLAAAVGDNRQNLANEIARAQSAEQGLENRKADKATTYTKTEVDTKIAGVQTFKKYLVQTLPDPDEVDMKGLYLVPIGETSEEGDLCEEWTVVEENGEKRWEKIGGTTVDLSNYYDKNAVNNLLNGKQDALTFDDAPTAGSNNPVKSSGIWSAIWGALAALPSGVSSLYDWVVAQLAGKLDGVVSVTHAELVAMRNAGQLKPGQQYRITDYVATTNGSSDSQSAGHPFDIIVTADDERSLNEHARATMHDGELPDDIVDGTTRRRYFADNDLAAWDVWYCIDNDDERFGWADTTNGRGVIYRLVDEFDNDIPYDFKGLRMKPLLDPFGEGVESYDTQYRYTFDMDGYDASLNLPDSGATVARNRIGPNGDAMAEPRQLNRVIFLGGDTTSNTLAGDCSEITIKEGHDNEFGHNCRYIFLGSWSSGNVFAPQCVYIKLGEACYNNMFGAGLMDSSFGNNCQCNVLGPYSVAEFGSSCSANFVAGNSQGAVVLGGECRDNYVGWENGRIECGRGCYANTFGAGCGEIYVGDGVLNCSFGSGCWVVYFKAPEGQIQGYFSNITFEEGLHMIYLFCSVDHGDEVPCANITVSKGVDGTALGDMIRIEVDDAGQNYKTTYKPAGSKEISVEVNT